jgi:hypothetical protein
MFRAMRAAVLIAAVLFALDARAEDPLLQQFLAQEMLEGPSHGFLAPNGRYRVRVPSGFVLQEGDDPDTQIFLGQVSGVDTTIIFRRIPVTPGASSSQLLLTTRDRFLQKLPHFTVLRQNQVKIAGRKCAKLIGRYDYQGNKGYPQIVENAYVVDEADGFIIHFEIPEGLYRGFERELNDLYKSFKTVAVPPQ